MRAIPCLLVALVSVAPLFAQQVGDPDFDARVERPAFVRVHPKVLFDEGHHNVHKTSATYKAFAELLRNDGCVVDVNAGPFTAEALRGHRLLVIAGALGAPLDDEAHAKDPAFTPAEVEVVRRWVRDGGALLLLTDHEPVASSEEALVRAFGVVPGKTVVLDKEHHFEHFYPSNILASRENGLLADHPITRGVGRVVVFGGQALSFPKTAAVLIRVAHHGDGQAGALRFGRGRVVIAGDMGMLSAQLFTENGVTNKWGMNVPGIDNRQLVLGIERWLLR